jgi:hypothetical protein
MKPLKYFLTIAVHCLSYHFFRSKVSTNGSVGPGISLSQAQPRKMVIKPFKVQPKLPENFENETWEKLKIAVSNVYNKNASILSKEELYRVRRCLGWSSDLT